MWVHWHPGAMEQVHTQCSTGFTIVSWWHRLHYPPLQCQALSAQRRDHVDACSGGDLALCQDLFCHGTAESKCVRNAASSSSWVMGVMRYQQVPCPTLRHGCKKKMLTGLDSSIHWQMAKPRIRRCAASEVAVSGAILVTHATLGGFSLWRRPGVYGDPNA